VARTRSSRNSCQIGMFQGVIELVFMHRYRSRIFVSFWVWPAIAAALSLPSSHFPLNLQFKDFRDRLFDSPPPPYSSGDVPALLTLSTLPPPSMGCSGWSMLLLLST
jgi:hypothetical protein